MLFLKNLLLRNFQGCCLLFNYQGSSLFSLIRSSFGILSRRFLFVKNFFIFLFTVCSGSVSPSQVSFNRLSHPLSSVKNFFHFVQRSALASCPTVALRLVLFIGLSQRQVVSYHGKSELSMFFLFFIFFAQFRQFTFVFTYSIMLLICCPLFRPIQNSSLQKLCTSWHFFIINNAVYVYSLLSFLPLPEYCIPSFYLLPDFSIQVDAVSKSRHFPAYLRKNFTRFIFPFVNGG